MFPKTLVLLFAYAAFAITTTPTSASDLSDLKTVTAWESVANGVWRARLGDLSQLRSYTSLAGAPPKIDQINKLYDSVDFPKEFGEHKIRFRATADHKSVVHIPLDSDEKIYGFGLQFDRTQRNGQILNLRVDHFNKGGGATHAPVPFYVSSRGYGVFFNTARFLKVHVGVGNRKDSQNIPPRVDRNPPDDEPQPGPWLAKPPGDTIEAYLHGDGIEVVVISGLGSKQQQPATLIQNVVAKYNLLSGGGTMPPLWGLGFWHRVPSKFSAEETLQEIAQFDEYKIPLDVIGLEPGWQTKSYPCTFEWQPKRFPDPEGFTKSLLDRGIRLNLWENPYVSPEAKIYKSLYPLSGSHMVWLGIVPDYNLPAAREILVSQHKQDHVDIGISGYKIDEVDGYDRWLWPDHATFPSGTSGETMRQTYGLLMQEMLANDLFRKSNRRTYGLVRASNGAAAAHPFVIYSDSYGHQQYITGLGSASLSGVLWCPEIRSARNSREWLNRMHTVCFSPMAMLNAWASGQKPWSFPEVTDGVRETIELRMRLLPYLYTAFHKYHTEGIPPVRSLLMEPGAANDDTAFMFGPDILVAPFFESNATERTIQLPAGNWYDFYTGRLVGNGTRVILRSDQLKDRAPLLVKEGAVIPMLARAVSNSEQAFGCPLEIRHYGKSPSNCLVYEDDGKTFEFESGKSRLRQFQVNDNGELKEMLIKNNAKPMFGSVTKFQSMSRGGQ